MSKTTMATTKIPNEDLRAFNGQTGLFDLFGEPLGLVHGGGAETYPMAVTQPPAKKRGQPNGYPRRPGTGPEDETCGTCKHACRVSIPSGRKFWKCELLNFRWTHGPGTDIRLKSPACKFWNIDPQERALRQSLFFGLKSRRAE